MMIRITTHASSNDEAISWRAVLEARGVIANQLQRQVVLTLTEEQGRNCLGPRGIKKFHAATEVEIASFARWALEAGVRLYVRFTPGSGLRGSGVLLSEEEVKDLAEQYGPKRSVLCGALILAGKRANRAETVTKTVDRSAPPSPAIETTGEIAKLRRAIAGRDQRINALNQRLETAGKEIARLDKARQQRNKAWRQLRKARKVLRRQ